MFPEVIPTMPEIQNPTGRVTVGAAIAAFLERCGVKAAFGVISIHNMPILDAIGERGRIRFVMARGEAGGANMADACNSDQNLHRDTLRAFFASGLGDDKKISAKTVGRHLKRHVGEPVRSGDRTLILRVRRDRTNAQHYRVEVKGA